MKYLSVCSGIEAATVAWEPLGFTPIAFSEIEKFPSAVLKYHYPNVPNLGDMNEWKKWKLPETPDILVGGTPCQSFSIAGLRKGLADPRGNLTLVYLSILERARPEWLVWENVPGVLSSDGGRAFGTFLGGLAELGYGWAYRVLDAQYFGVAQRRRRVFVVGCAGGAWQRAAAVLFECESLQRNSKKKQTEREITVSTIQEGIKQSIHCSNVSKCLNAGGASRLDTETESFISIHYTDQQGSEYGHRVRRLTPLEWERLQGFSDGYTSVPWKGGSPPDKIRCKAIGNSMAVPVMRWIGSRLKEITTRWP